ncbi:MAG: SAM-dependent methyltransferase, partial [Chloroflexi bacterium]|nr:SAM-dependent methyltransferase [Chloroflexota bacterium]
TGDLAAAECQDLLDVWFRVMSGSGSLPSAEAITRMREAYGRDVAILPPQDVREIIMRGGFDAPVQFFQAGMIHAWFAKRSAL